MERERTRDRDQEPAGFGTLSTTILLQRAQEGDDRALEGLCARFLPRLRRWASGRLPGWARSLLDTGDLVQETLVRTVAKIEGFEPRGEPGALHAYLRRALLNRIRDEIRRVRRRPLQAEFEGDEEAEETTPLEAAIGGEVLERYEAALGRLRPREQEAVVARIEMGCSYQEIAEVLGKPSADAARMAVSRALVRLAKEMGHEP